MSPVFFVRSALTAMAVALAWSGASEVLAADTSPPPPPPVYGAAPVFAGDPGCASCQSGTCTTCKAHGKKHCNMCDKWPHNKKPPYPVTLCPGSCFGYFQTQWRKWDEVCPYPYQGMGVTDAGRLPGVTPPTQPGTGLPQPRPIDPKMMDPKKVGSDLPPIPMPPGGKFAQ